MNLKSRCSAFYANVLLEKHFGEKQKQKWGFDTAMFIVTDAI